MAAMTLVERSAASEEDADWGWDLSDIRQLVTIAGRIHNSAHHFAMT